MACSREKARLDDVGLLASRSAASSASADVAALSDVDEGNDDAFDPVVLGAIGQYPTDIPWPLRA